MTFKNDFPLTKWANKITENENSIIRNLSILAWRLSLPLFLVWAIFGGVQFCYDSDKCYPLVDIINAKQLFPWLELFYH